MAAYKDSGEIGDIAYLFNSDPNVIVRYDLESETWLEPIWLPLGDTGGGMVIHGDDIYVSVGVHIYRYDADGSNETLIWTQPATITDIPLWATFWWSPMGIA